MTEPQATPFGGFEWLGNARVHEQNRRDARDTAAELRRLGDELRAIEMETLAEVHATRRDRVQREELVRMAGRSARRGRF